MPGAARRPAAPARRKNARRRLRPSGTRGAGDNIVSGLRSSRIEKRMRIWASGKTLGARIEEIDLAQPLVPADLRQILRALGEHGVLCFPNQRLEVENFAAFGRLFGDLEINVANQFHEPGFPEVMLLSNMVVDGKPVGLSDAGQGWHTDMSYSKEIALANVLHAIRVPMREGRPLGDTQFRNMRAAYADLPDSIKARLEGATRRTISRNSGT